MKFPNNELPVYIIETTISKKVADWCFSLAEPLEVDPSMVVNTLLIWALVKMDEDPKGKQIPQFMDILYSLEKVKPTLMRMEHDDAN